MPNWCFNYLQVTGPAETLARFTVQAVGADPWSQPGAAQPVAELSFHRLVPIPPVILAAGHMTAGYEWERRHWGCKWGACEAVLAERWDGGLCYQFQTAWCPPLSFLKAVSRAWPELVFELEYEEAFTSLQGFARAERGTLQDHCGGL